MSNPIDLLLIKPGAQKELYQNLSETLSGREPPLWTALLAAFIREKGFKVKIVDAEIEPEKVIPTVTATKPKLIAIVVSGTNPSASTMNMVGARTILHEIMKLNPDYTTILLGLHPSALPERTLSEEPVDMVCEGEGFLTLLDLLSEVGHKNFKGLWYIKDSWQILSFSRHDLINLNDLPMPAWDLLPMHKYRAHNWHCFGGSLKDRSPYGVIYTSLGCPYNCSFCCIHALFGAHKIRYRSPEKVVEEIDYLVKNYDIKKIKIIDEIFDLKESHVTKLCDLIIERDYELDMWAYTRVNTINERKLKKMKQAGINWLGIGFEAGSKEIRDGVSKGQFDNERIREVVKMIRDAGINIGGNFVFGLPGDTMKTMQETLNLAKELNCEWTNFNCCMAYPGSKLYEETKKRNLPDSWLGYSQYAYETQPLPTEHLTAAEILQFRDNAFNTFYGSTRYQDMILEKFGAETLQHIKDVLKHKIRRRLIE